MVMIIIMSLTKAFGSVPSVSFLAEASTLFCGLQTLIGIPFKCKLLLRHETFVEPGSLCHVPIDGLTLPRPG